MGIVEVAGLLGTFGVLILVLAVIAFILISGPSPRGSRPGHRARTWA